MPLRPSPSVLRAGALLQRLAASPHRAMNASELARLADIPRATCNSVLLALTELGLVERDDELRYQLGSACIGLGDAARTADAALRAAAAQAEALARSIAGVAAVSMVDGDQTRVAYVFDFGPAFGLRPRAGDSIGLVPPFGATFVAWDDDTRVDAWLARTEPPLSDTEAQRYRAALHAVRRRGYSITVGSDRQANLAAALEQLAEEPDGDARQRRDQAIRDIAHGEYLAAEVDPGVRARLTQISAPVFDPDGSTSVSVMVLGPDHELSADEIAVLGARVKAAADGATRAIGGTVPATAR